MRTILWVMVGLGIPVAAAGWAMDAISFIRWWRARHVRVRHSVSDSEGIGENITRWSKSRAWHGDE